ncbi:MAG: hypothetical protein RIS21_680 [Planctomycetota bacterium]|jgi:hypothetical protein
MAIALDPNRSHRYVLREDASLPVEDQTVFLLRSLTVRDDEMIQNSKMVASSGGEFRLQPGTEDLMTLRLGLIGVENFRDGAGKMVHFDADKAGRVTDAFLSRLKKEWRNEIADQIRTLNALTVDEKKA